MHNPLSQRSKGLARPSMAVGGLSGRPFSILLMPKIPPLRPASERKPLRRTRKPLARYRAGRPLSGARRTRTDRPHKPLSSNSPVRQRRFSFSDLRELGIVPETYRRATILQDIHSQHVRQQTRGRDIAPAFTR